MRKLLWLLAFVLVVLSSAHAVGIAPAKISLTLPPGDTRSITFFAVNDLDSEVFVEPYISGDLAADAKLPGKIRLAPNGLTPFSITVSVPNGFKEKYDSYVGVMSAAGSPNAGLTTRIAAESLLEVKTVLNKPMLQLSLNAKNEAPVSLHLNVKNPTTVNVNGISGRITIADSAFNKLASFSIAPFNLAPSASKGLVFDWAPTRDGEFSALAEVNFQGGSEKAETKFTIGKQSINITNVQVNKKVGVVEISVEVKNNWNSPIEAWAEVTALVPNGATEAQTKTQTQKIPAGEIATLNAYWETQKNPDEFDFNIAVHYGDNTIERLVRAKQPAKEADKTERIGAALSSLSGAFSALGNIKINKTYSAIAIALIAIIFTALFAYQRRKPPEQNKYDEYYRKYYEYLSRQNKKDEN